MSNSKFPRGEHSARRPAQPLQRQRWSSRGTSLLVGVAVLQGACSLLIEIDDGVDDEPSPDASTAEAPIQPGAPQEDAAVPLPEATRDAGSDAELEVEVEAGAPGPAPALALAFIERPQEGEAALRLVDARAALRARSGDVPAWRRTLRPAAQAGAALDFAWSPDGRRLAVRHAALGGPRLALFAAPDWRELPIAAAGSPASLPRLTAAAGYRWSPDGSALAVELASEQGVFVGGYVVSDESAREIGPVPFTGPVESLEWLTSSSLLVLQPEAGEPELLELALEEGALGSPTDRFLIGAFFPIELRRSAGGVIGASPDPTNFVFFWPATAEAGFESAFSPSAYLSSRESFAAEPDEVAALSRLFRIGDSSVVLDTLPQCPVVLAWSEGPSPGSLAGSRVVCLNVSGEAASLTLHAHDAAAERQARQLDDAVLLADYAVAASWESHARVMTPGGDWLALATAGHDAIVDLRGPAPLYHVRSAASAAGSALAFSPSGRYLLAQRGAQLELTVLAPAAEPRPIHVPLPGAAAELAACELARHVPTFCGSPTAARRAAARWSASEDVAALLSGGDGLMLLAPTDDVVGVASVSVSTCGSGCVEQYEFAE
jgi:hypothetical protein